MTPIGVSASRVELISTNDYLYPEYAATKRHELRKISTASADLYFLHIYSEFLFFKFHDLIITPPKQRYHLPFYKLNEIRSLG